MSALQIAAVAITIGLNALDGFDVLAISFASPGISRARGIDRAALGIVLSMELIGMGLGSICIGGVADRIGRRRSLNVSLMAIGYPIGAVVGGIIAAVLLRRGDWRVVFEFGALMTAAFLPLVWCFVPESIAWLCQRRPAAALAQLNRTLMRMRHATVADLPAACSAKSSLADIFRPGMLQVTLTSNARASECRN